MKKLLNLLFNGLASYALSVTVMIFMFLIILFGTLYQVDNGLYAAQQKYFDSIYVLHQWKALTIPLPGAYLLMVILAINLLCGGFIRIRKNKYTIGILIVHFGIAFMLVSCAMTFHWADRGHMRLNAPYGGQPGQTSDEFVSYVDWSIEIAKGDGTKTMHIIPEEKFEDLVNGKTRTFHNDALPFEVVVSDYSINTFISPQRPFMPDNARVIDGYFLDIMPPELQAERNLPGLHVSMKDTASGEISEGILWSMSNQPLTVNAGGEPWTLGLVRKRWNAPFTVTLDEFIHDKHAGSSMARSYESYITKTEGDSQDVVRIWMNHPLRYKGYTFFQESFGPPDAKEGDQMYSQFSVVRNPGDQGPLYACIIIGIGMLIHFIQKLMAYMRIEAKRRTS